MELQREKAVFINLLDTIRSGYNPPFSILKWNKAIIRTFKQNIKKCEEKVVAETKGFEFVQKDTGAGLYHCKDL